MDVVTWFQGAGAVTFGCLVAVAFVHACDRAARLERDEDGEPSYDVPWWMIAAWLLPVALLSWTVWSLAH